MFRSKLCGVAFLALCGCTPTNNSRPAGPEAAAAAGPSPQAPAAPSAVAEEARLIETCKLSLEALRKDLEAKGEVYRQRPAGAPLTEKAADILIKTRVRTRLENDPEVPSMSLDVEVDRGRVTLTGRVGRVEEVQRALLAALKVPEVNEVVSKLAVEPDDGSGATKGEAPTAPGK